MYATRLSFSPFHHFGVGLIQEVRGVLLPLLRFKKAHVRTISLDKTNTNAFIFYHNKKRREGREEKWGDAM